MANDTEFQSSKEKNEGWTITGERRTIGDYDSFKAVKNILLITDFP